MLRRLIVRDRETAGKKFVTVVALNEHHSLREIAKAVALAHNLGVDDPAAIALLLRQNVSSSSIPLDAAELPEAANIEPPQVKLDAYDIAALKEIAA